MLIGFYLSAAFPSFFSVYKFSKSIKIQFNSPPAFVTQFKARKTRQKTFFSRRFFIFSTFSLLLPCYRYLQSIQLSGCFELNGPLAVECISDPVSSIKSS